MKKKWVGLLLVCMLVTAQTVCMAEWEISDSPLYDGLRFVREDGKSGYINMDGDIVVPIEYDMLSYFCEGVAIISKDGKYGYVDNQGNIVVSLEYEETVEFKPQSNGLAPVRKDGRWGYMENPLRSRNADGSPVIHWIDNADRLDDFYNGYAMIIRSNTFSVINLQFQEIFGGQYDYIEQAQHDNFFIVSQNGKKGVFRYDGTAVLPLEYDEIYMEQMEPGVRRFRVEKDGKYGLYNLDGSVSLACIFDDIQISPDSEDIVIAAWNGCYGIVNSVGDEYIPFIYEEILRDADCYQIKLDGKYGILRKDFAELVPPIYEEIGGGFQKGNPQMVKKDGLCGYIDENGTIVIPPQFEKADMFRGGMAVVKQNGKYGCINIRGEFVIPPEYDRIERPFSGEAYMEKDGVRTAFVNPMALEYNVPEERFIVLQIGNDNMYTGDYSPLNAKPVLVEGRTFLPLRAVVEQMGGRVSWNEDIRTAEFVYGEKTVEIQPDTIATVVNGEEILMDVPPQIVNGTTMMPLRFIMEELGAEVQWDGPTQKVTITY